jgi:hypothetical protein
MTMNVTEITARFMRRIQIKDYEPAEAEISLKAHLEDGEDFVAAGTTLILQSREIALTGLRGKTAGETETAVTVTETAKAPTAAEQKKAEAAHKRAEKKAAKEAAEAAKSTDSDIPGDDGDTAKPATDKADSDVPGDDIPGETDTETDTDDAMTIEDLQSYITSQVSGKKIVVKAVKEILAGVGASRTSEVKPEDIESVREAIELGSKA